MTSNDSLIRFIVGNGDLSKGDYPGHPFRGNQWTGGKRKLSGRGLPKVDAAMGSGSSAKAGTKPETPALRKKHVIPPAWTDVVFTKDEGKSTGLIATGKDAKGVTQYRYTALHRKTQDAAKFDRVRKLTPLMPILDKKLKSDATTNGTAGALTLCRRLGLRIGGEGTKADTKAYGATNLERRHVKITPTGLVTFDFIGKKGVRIKLKTRDPEVRRVIQAGLDRTEGSRDQLFPDATPARALKYLDDAMPAGVDMKSHDLRTIKANEVALAEIALWHPPENAAELKQWKAWVAQTVADQLGNNASEALKSYINPSVFAEWDSEAAGAK